MYYKAQTVFEITKFRFSMNNTITHEHLRLAIDSLILANSVSIFDTFVGSWVISVSPNIWQMKLSWAHTMLNNL